MHISQLWNKEAIDGLLACYSVASVSHEWPWTGSLKSHDQLALEQRLLWLCMPMRELQSLPAAVAALESGVCTWSSSCVSLLIHLTQAVALQVALVDCSGVSLFVHLTQAVASLPLYVGCDLVPVSSGNVPLWFLFVRVYELRSGL